MWSARRASLDWDECAGGWVRRTPAVKKTTGAAPPPRYRHGPVGPMCSCRILFIFPPRGKKRLIRLPDDVFDARLGDLVIVAENTDYRAVRNYQRSAQPFV